MNAPQSPQPAQLIAWNIILADGKSERVNAVGFQPLGDGSLVFGDFNGPVRVYNARIWDKVERSNIHPA